MPHLSVLSIDKDIPCCLFFLISVYQQHRVSMVLQSWSIQSNIEMKKGDHSFRYPVLCVCVGKGGREDWGGIFFAIHTHSCLDSYAASCLSNHQLLHLLYILSGFFSVQYSVLYMQLEVGTSVCACVYPIISAD